MELWFILSFIPGLLWGIVNVFDKIFVDKYFKDIFSFFFFYNIVSPLILAVFIYIYGFQLIDLKYIFIAFLSSLSYFGTNYFYVKSLETEEVSKVVPIYSTSVIFVLLYDIVFFQENIEPFSALGIVFIVLGSMFLLSKDLSLNIFRPRKALFYMLVSSFIWSLIYLLTKIFLEIYSFGIFVIYQLIFQIQIALSLLLFKKPKANIINTQNKIKNSSPYFFIGFAEILDLGALFTLQFILGIGIASYVSAIGQIQYIFVLLFSTLLSLFYPHLINEEITIRILGKKIIYIILIIIGVIIIKLNTQ